LAKVFVAFAYKSMWGDWEEENMMHQSHLGFCGGEKRRMAYQI